MTTEAGLRKAFEGAVDKCAVADLNNIHRVSAVMSGKGGAARSLVSGRPTVTLRRDGYQAGVLDAKITGPSIVKMLFSSGAGLGLSLVGPLPPQTWTGIRVMFMNLLPEQEYLAADQRGNQTVLGRHSVGFAGPSDRGPSPRHLRCFTDHDAVIADLGYRASDRSTRSGGHGCPQGSAHGSADASANTGAKSEHESLQGPRHG